MSRDNVATPEIIRQLGALQIKPISTAECDCSLTALNLDVKEPVVFINPFSERPQVSKTGDPVESGRGIGCLRKDVDALFL